MAARLTAEQRGLRAMAREVNARMSALREAGYTGAPAYQYMMSTLDLMGARQLSTRKNYDRPEHAALRRIMRGFLASDTSTPGGYESYRARVTRGLRERFGDEAAEGLDDEDLMDAVTAYAESREAAVYGSETEINLVLERMKRQSRNPRLAQWSADEIVRRINRTRSYKSARRSLGL